MGDESEKAPVRGALSGDPDQKWIDALHSLALKISGTKIVALYYSDAPLTEIDREQTLKEFLLLYGVKVPE